MRVKKHSDVFIPVAIVAENEEELHALVSALNHGAIALNLKATFNKDGDGTMYARQAETAQNAAAYVKEISEKCKN